MKNTLLLICLFVTANFYAQKKVDIKLNLRDGSTISGTTTMNDLILKTDYGQLSVPIQNVSTILVGIGKDKAISDKAQQSLKILNTNGSDETKKGAYDDLISLGIKAISSINDFLEDPKSNTEADITGEYTIDNALSELKSKYAIEDASKINDVITIDNEYTMGGAYEFIKLDIKTEYGNLSIPKERIKMIEVSYSEPGNGNETVLKLSANKNISGNTQGGWLKTGIMLKQGQKFTITATGEVTLASLSNQKYKPDGSYISTTGVPYPATTATDEFSSGTAYPIYGNVVYKIGETGYDVLKAGAKFTGMAKTPGMLMISIYETVYNAANTGSYNVKVSLK